MVHVTFNSGVTRYCPPEEIRDDQLELLVPLVRKNGGWINTGDSVYRVDLKCHDGIASFSLFDHTQPLLTSTLVWDVRLEQTAWRLTEKSYFDFSDKHPNLMGQGESPEKPDSIPWLATILWPVYGKNGPMQWSGNFELCLSYAILFHKGFSLANLP